MGDIIGLRCERFDEIISNQEIVFIDRNQCDDLVTCSLPANGISIEATGISVYQTKAGGQTLTAKIYFDKDGDEYSPENIRIKQIFNGEYTDQAIWSPGPVGIVSEEIMSQFAEAYPGKQITESWIQKIASTIVNKAEEKDDILNNCAAFYLCNGKNPFFAGPHIFQCRDFFEKAFTRLYGAQNNIFDYKLKSTLEGNFTILTSADGIQSVSAVKREGRNTGVYDTKICAKCIVIWTVPRGVGQVQLSGSSFNIRVDEVPNEQTIDNIIEKFFVQQPVGSHTSFDNWIGTPPDENGNGGSGILKNIWDVYFNGGSFRVPPVLPVAGFKFKFGLDTKESGVFNLGASFGFGRDLNGSFFINNLLLKINLNVSQYATEVGRMQQYMARLRERMNNMRTRLQNEQLAAQKAAAEYVPPQDLSIPEHADTQTTDPTRVGSSEETGGTNTTDGNVNNGGNETRTTEGSDPVLDDKGG